MFGWFKKKPSARVDAVPDVIKQMMEPMALATALAETISEYFKAVEKGKVSSPAYQRKADSVVGIWTDTRLETLRHLWGYGTLFQVYLFLNKAGSAVGDKETDSHTLRLANKTIISEFEQHSSALWAQWIAFEQAVRGSGVLPAMPSTLLEILYKDVTKKAKTIALATQFGPDYESGMNYLANILQKQMKDQGDSEDSINMQLEQVRSTMKKVLAADDPDHLA